MARVELFIWWTTDTECRALGAECHPSLPDYVRHQYRVRSLHKGESLLWVDPRFGNQSIAEWPDTSIARGIQDGSSGGVVFSAKDLHLFKDSVIGGGVVTDFKLRMMVVT